jgi:transposase-like protein
MGTTEIVALVVVAIAAIAIAAIYGTANTRQFEKRRRQAEERRDEGGIDVLSSDHSPVDASAREPAEPENASRQRRPDREIEEDRARDIARERESHRL